MPPKRRIRNGSNVPSAAHILKPLISSSLPSAAAVAATASAALLANSAAHHHHHHNNYTNNNSDLSSSVANGSAVSVPLTAKQLQQLERNTYLTSLTKDQLKVECRKRGQKINGNKTDLLQRLGFKMSNQQNHNNTTAGTGQNNAQQRSGSTAKLLATTPNGSSMAATAPSFVRKQNAKDKERERADRERLVLWRQPLLTAKYCFSEIVILLQTYRKKILENKLLIALAIGVLFVLAGLYHVPGPHQLVYAIVRSNLWFVLYWLGLGVLSSVGLGTGLHTFLLYLGPHIASVTLAAYECNSLDFPRPPYPDEIICPEFVNPKFIPSLWSIMSKVRPEAFLWGAGTALGELPPYFMAKASRLSGFDPEDDDDLKEFEELKKKRESGAELSLLDRAKVSMERVVERIGFLGILACASIPNPLFDLAGITCGHFLVPFWTFFGATLIGKAVIKMHIQKVFVIIAFNEALIQKAVDFLGIIPVLGRYAQEPFKAFLKNQKSRLHRSSAAAPPTAESRNILAKVFEYFVVAMVCYFVLSIVNSLAQSYHKRIHKKGGKVHRKVAKD